MATPNADPAAMQQRILDLEAQLAAAVASSIASTSTTQKLKHPEPEKFSGGTSEPSIFNWVDQVDAYLTALGHENTVQGAATASAYLQGQARTWLRFVKGEAMAGRAPAIASWPDLRQRMIDKFTPLNFKQVAMDRLQRLVQLKAVRSFNQRFSELLLEIGSSMTEESLLLTYLNNLKPALSVQVRLQQPTTVLAAMKLAEAADDAVWQVNRDRPPARPPQHQPRAQQRHSQPPRSHSNGSGPQPMELGALSALTDTERKKMMSEGKCFKCRQTGHRAKDCPTRRQQTARASPAQGN